ncbi:peptidase domain-containing ABC transporter [Crocosphaera sp. XPORK-15E]|uniref:peptidase domain-containing ABC transporter n=1 Tax=Crocosphaera sp. XPORK-15E TaxID=3110247 RepID=UPI002B20D651|nr:peptidase domain-containing ABC transporter [Crocosphaera sp. XPORK-15E]MEA5536361.1 peptidase domain-containing ABC transporter [Crocosphaera sp. XPORK-15E]
MKSSSAMSPEFEQNLQQILGQKLPEKELDNCLKQVKILTPPSGQLFWQSSTHEKGIYILIKGKVRLLDEQENLLVTLGTGSSFGELTLFPQDSFQPYLARASINLKIYYLDQDWAYNLLAHYPTIEAHLHQQAILQDLLLLCRQHPSLNHTSPKEIRDILSLLKRHSFKGGKLPNPLLKDAKLWLVRRGELQNESGKLLRTGDINIIGQERPPENWQIIQPTELYSLNHSDWQKAVEQVPQLQDIAPTSLQSKPTNQVFSLPNPRELSEISDSPQTSKHQAQAHIRRAYFPSPTLQVTHWWQRVTRRYPTYLQQSVTDCGAACLVMIGRHWGKNFSISRLRDIANVDRNGSSLRGLAAAGESMGFATRPIKASLDKLAEQSLPAIVHWEGNHYVVVYEIGRKQVIIGDPAIGQRSLTLKNFQAGWTGYALLLQPTVEIKKSKEATQPLWQFFELAKPHKLVLAEVFIASIFIQIFGLVTPVLTQLLLDRVVVQRSNTTLIAVGLGLLIFGLFKVAMSGLRQYLLDHTANRVDMALIVGFIRHTFRLPLSFFESRYVGDIMSRVGENRKIQQFMTGEALSVFLDVLTMFVYAGVMFWYSWKLALLVLVVLPPIVLLTLGATPFLKRISREIFQAVAAENRYLIQALTGVRTIKSMAVEQTVRWEWEDHLHKLVKTRFTGQIIGNRLQILSGIMQTVSTTALLWYGAWLVINNEMTIGQLVAFNMLMGNVISPFQRLAGLWNQLQEVVIAVERINDVLDSEPEEDLHHQLRQFLPALRGHIRFDHVTFRYHPESDVNVLENLSFEVQPGQMIALVGRSGSGKTTISKLILGLYPPTEGNVLIDGYDITSLSLRSLRQQVGVVDQDTFLFGGTIQENISLGCPEATLEEVIKAAEMAGADKFIKQLPMGYETRIGEGGGLLSGGQRQRLAIARALLGDPPLLIFDEATSHLDSESERLIQTNLETLLRDRTSIVIAHRLSTVRRADLILVLDQGVLVEKGTHDQLIAKQGTYFYLNQQQLAGIPT